MRPSCPKILCQHHLVYNLKKTLYAAEQHRQDVTEKRDQWKQQESFDIEKLVFIDETWTKTNMTPCYGQVERGKRLIAP